MNTSDFTIWEDAKIYSTRSLLLQKILESYALDDGKGIEQFFFFFGCSSTLGCKPQEVGKALAKFTSILKNEI